MSFNIAKKKIKEKLENRKEYLTGWIDTDGNIVFVDLHNHLPGLLDIKPEYKKYYNAYKYIDDEDTKQVELFQDSGRQWHEYLYNDLDDEMREIASAIMTMAIKDGLARFYISKKDSTVEVQSAENNLNEFKIIFDNILDKREYPDLKLYYSNYFEHNSETIYDFDKNFIIDEDGEVDLFSANFHCF